MGDPAQEGTTATAGPLAGVSVLDLSSVGPAAHATRLLADYGASVVKVAPPPGRGPATQAPPYFAYGAHRAMQKVLVDLRDPDGRSAFLTLAAKSDVVVESFRPGTVERLGISYDDVKAMNPRVIYCSTTGYGRDGARSSWAGHDLDYLAVGGFLSMCEPTASGGPPLPGATIADAAAGGMQAALSICAALFARMTTGEGTFLDVSVTDGVLWLMSLLVDEHLATGTEPAPGHDVLTGRYACYATYRARDGRWLAVAAIEPKFFDNLCKALDCERWIVAQYDDEAQASIRSDFQAVFATEDRDRWVERLASSDTCVAPVHSIADIGSDEQLVSSRAVVEAKSARHGTFRQLGALLAGMPPLSEPVSVPDEAATDTVELLTAVGYDPDVVAELVSKGVVA